MALSFENLDDFFQLDEFATSVQVGEVGSEVTIKAIFDDQAVLINDAYAAVNTAQPLLTAKTSDLKDVEEGTRFYIEGVEYRSLAPELDRTGISTVRLMLA